MTAEPYKLGLTGSIAMGKTTTAGFFRAADVPVWDADAVVHQLYSAGGAGVPAIATLAPTAISGGAVDRDVLRSEIGKKPELLQKIEAAIHPLVARNRQIFLDEQRDSGADLVVFDIPLLFETNAEDWLDGVLCVTAPTKVQRERVLARPGMTNSLLEKILSRQMPDHEKRQRADYTIDTAMGLDAARAAVLSLIKEIRAAKHA